MTISQDANHPLVLVIGATGKQGGSVVAALLASDRRYRIRAVTRDTTKPAALALREQGVELLQLSLTLDNLAGIAKAFEGADYAFAVTNFWEHADTTREVYEGKALVDGAKAAKVKLLVWSGLPSVHKHSSGKYKVDPFDGKAVVTEYARSTGLPFVDVQAGWYAENPQLLGFFTEQPDSSYEFKAVFSPDTRLPIIDIRDYGLYVRAAIEDDEHVNFPLGASIPTYGQLISMVDMAKDFERVTGKKTTFVQQDMAEWEAKLRSQMPSYPAEEIIKVFKSKNEFGYYGTGHAGEVPDFRQYLPKKPTTWAEFVAAQGSWMGTEAKSNLDAWAEFAAKQTEKN